MKYHSKKIHLQLDHILFHITDTALVCFAVMGCYNSDTSEVAGSDAGFYTAPTFGSPGEGTSGSTGRGTSGTNGITGEVDNGDVMVDSGKEVGDIGIGIDGDIGDAARSADAGTEGGETDQTGSYSDLGYDEVVPNFNTGGNDIVNVVAGENSTCVVKSDGDVVCWGKVRFDFINTIRKNEEMTPYTQVMEKDGSICVIGSNGHINCYADFFGSTLSGVVPSDGTYTQICSSTDHACALDIDGNVTCWGRYLEVGYKSSTTKPMSDPPAGEYIQLSCSTSPPCALTSDGSIACWEGALYYASMGMTLPLEEVEYSIGTESYVEFRAPLPSQRFTQFSRRREICAVTDDGHIVCWVSDPAFADIKDDIPEGSFTQVSVGGSHTCALRSDGSAVCWGDNDYNSGNLGCSDERRAPIAPSATPFGADCSMWYYPRFGLALVPGGPYTQISAGKNHACAVNSNGSIDCWGDNSFLKSTVPSGPYQQVCGSCALKSDNTIVCWNGEKAPSGTFLQLDYRCAIKDDHSIVCWGEGYENENENIVPTGSFSHLSVSDSQICAVTDEGRITCWNKAGFGEFEPETDEWEYYPPDPPQEPSFKQVSPSDGLTSCAIKNDQSIACWGIDGIEEDLVNKIPTGSFEQVSVGSGFACALGTDARISCWGGYYHSIEGLVPMIAPEGSYLQIAAGYNHVCAIAQDGRLVCWGNDSKGYTTAPPGSYSQLAPSADCAISTDGDIVCWGDARCNNYNGDTLCWEEENALFLPAQL